MKLIKFLASTIKRLLRPPSIAKSSIPEEKVTIGKDCTIISCKFNDYNKVGEYSFLYNTEYGSYTYSARNVTIMNCVIGKFCSIAQGVSIGLGKHPVNSFVSTHPAFYSTNKQCGATFASEQHFIEMGRVSIGHDVWIGADSIILDDVTIGNGAIIAANSVVNQDVPPYAIVGGTPAKILKFRFPQEDIAFLQDFLWWNKSEDWLLLNLPLMHDINKLKNSL